MSVYTVQASFARGEMTPKLIDRQNYEQYQLGMSTCSNLVIMRHGGVTRRPGTRFITEVKDSDKKVRLIPYEFNNIGNQNYILEFGEYYMRVIKDQGQLVHGTYSITAASQTNPVKITIDNHPFASMDSIDISDVSGMTELNGNTYTVTNVNPEYTITGITQANPGVVTCSGGHNFVDDELVYIEDVEGMGELNNNAYVVENCTSTTFELQGIDTSGFGAYSSGGVAKNFYDTFELSGINGTGYTAYVSGGDAEYTSETIVEISTPYDETEIFELDYAYSLDVMYIAHPSYAPRRLSRTSHTTWFLDLVIPIDGPYLAKNITGNHAELGGDIIAGQLTTVQFDNLTNINNGLGFSSADLGRPFRWEKRYATDPDSDDVSLNNDFLVGWGFINAVNNSTNIDVQWVGTAGEENAYGQVIVDVQNGSNVPDTDDGGDSDRSNWWWLGAWYGADNWPAKVRFFGDAERIVWGRSNDYPLSMWFSRTADFENFVVSDKDGQVLDDHGFTRTINSDGAHPILWMEDGTDALVVGTSKKIYGILQSTENEVFSPNNSKAATLSINGALERKPVRIGDSLLYQTRYGTQLREMVFNFQTNSYESPDASILSEHLLKSPLDGDLQYAQHPNASVWMFNEDGKAPILTYERDQKTVGWAQAIIAGGNADTHGVVENIATVQGTTRDETYLVVKRTINGATKRYIELVEAPFDYELGDDLYLPKYLDSHVTYDGAGVTSLSSGFDHLRGETVGVMVNGIYQGLHDIPESGSFTIPNSLTATKVVMGFPYESRGKLLPPVIQGQDGTLIGRKKSYVEVTFTLFESSLCDSLEVGFTDREGNEYFHSLIKEEIGLSLETVPEIVSRRINANVDDSWDEHTQLEFKITDPYPLSVLAVTSEIEMEP